MREPALGCVLLAAVWLGACSSGAHGGGAGSAAGGSASAGNLLVDGSASGGTSGAAASSGTGGIAGAGVGGQNASAAGAGGTAGGSAGQEAGTGGSAGQDAGAGATGGSTGQDSGAGATGGSTGQDAGAGSTGGSVGQAGSDGGVDAMLCAPGSYNCSGDELRQCTSDGSGYSTVTMCKAGHCSAASGKCLECLAASECTVSGECEQATCTNNACGSTPLQQGTACSQGVCNGQGVCGCVPGARRCSSNVPETCDANGVWQSASACGGATPDCYDGYCEPTTPPSCASLGETCGANSSSYCCASRAIPGGTYSRSYDGVSPYTDASYTATVSDFRLDVYEVSVARFRAFMDAGEGTQANPPAAGAGKNPAIGGSGWDASWDGNLQTDTSALQTALNCSSQFATWTDTPGANEARPINCVSWYEAFAFCAWDGARLPTEAEWNYAAAGGSEQRAYPWSAPFTSTAIDPTQASYWVDGTQTCMGDGQPGCTLSDLVPVGSKPDGVGRWGQFGLGGNVWEWTLDVYENPYAENPCVDCADLSKGSSRVIRGGSFFANATSALSPMRSYGAADGRFYSVGLRCAR